MLTNFQVSGLIPGPSTVGDLMCTGRGQLFSPLPVWVKAPVYPVVTASFKPELKHTPEVTAHPSRHVNNMHLPNENNQQTKQ